MPNSITYSENWIEKNRIALIERNEARRVPGQWYRRALRLEKENAALEGRFARTCDYFNAIREKYQIESGVMFGDWIDEQVAQLAAANADGSTVICPECGSEFIPAGG